MFLGGRRHDSPSYHYCPDHAYDNGFCSCCGAFWGGIDSFDHNNPAGVCEHCRDAIETDCGDPEPDEDWCGEMDYECGLTTDH